MTAYDGVILAGGQGRRLGGADKAQVVLGGRSLLSRALDAMAGAGSVVVVGDVVEPVGRAQVVVEAPAGGGPVAAVDAAVPLVNAAVVAVLAVDMPLVTSSVIDELADAAVGHDGCVLVDAQGRRQPLAAAYRTSAITAALSRLGRIPGSAMRDLLTGLEVAEIWTHTDETLDCDTWDSVAQARRILEAR
jgi:molybdopterin-guanine dinucleotide biosynthesis protein A